MKGNYAKRFFRRTAIEFAKQEKAMFPHLPTKSIIARSIFFAHRYMEEMRKEEDIYKARVWTRGLSVTSSEKPRQRISFHSNGNVHAYDEECDDNRLTQFGVSCHTLPSSNPVQLNFIHD